MSYFPLFMTLKNRPVLVVGGNETAARKIRLLQKSPAVIHVCAASLCPELSEKAASGVIEHIQSPLEDVLKTSYAFIISATDDLESDKKIAVQARQRNIPINVVDRPALSDFIVPAIIDRSPVVVAVSSGGAAPVLARRIRAQIETLLPTNLGKLAALSARFRSAVKSKLSSEQKRKQFWERFFDGAEAKQFLNGDEDQAYEALLKSINAANNDEKKAGKVLLVGAGPGDPDLLTMRAFRALQNADLIVTDRLVDDRILDLARRDAERVFVGKEKDRHTVDQSIINRILADAAHKGQNVVRLKGGDPFVFGRGGEEMEYLQKRNIEVEVVPGITAAIGAAASAGFPLTHRAYERNVSFVTGHPKVDGEELDWNALVASKNSLVFYMGVSKVEDIQRNLISSGKSPETSIAIIENATRPTQRILTGNLQELSTVVKENHIQAPALLVVGNVTKFLNKTNPNFELSNFEITEKISTTVA